MPLKHVWIFLEQSIFRHMTDAFGHVAFLVHRNHKIHNKIDMLCMWKKKGEIIWIRHI